MLTDRQVDVGWWSTQGTRTEGMRTGEDADDDDAQAERMPRYRLPMLVAPSGTVMQNIMAEMERNGNYQMKTREATTRSKLKEDGCSMTRV